MTGVGSSGVAERRCKSEKGISLTPLPPCHNLLRYGNIISHFSPEIEMHLRGYTLTDGTCGSSSSRILPRQTNTVSMNKIMKFFQFLCYVCVSWQYRKENFVLCNPHVEIIKPHCIILK